MSNSSSSDERVLTSLPLLGQLRAENAGSIYRPEGSNLDILQLPPRSTNDTVTVDEGAATMPICPLNMIFVMKFVGSVKRAFSVMLAAHHLNVGDGSIVPQVEGLNKRCSIRFTLDIADTDGDTGIALNHVANVTSLPSSATLGRPCAFIGAGYSRVSMSTGIISGLRGYPQVSSASTSAILDDKVQYPLFARTVPSDHGTSVPLILYMYNILGIRHLAVMNVDDGFGTSYVQGLLLAAQEHAPDMQIHHVAFNRGEFSEGDLDFISIKAAIESVKETQYRFIFCIALERFDEIMEEAYKQEIAGDGLHNWFIAGLTTEVLGRDFQKGSPLQLAYQGITDTGNLLTGGSFQNFEQKMAELNNPQDVSYMYSLLPPHIRELHADYFDSILDDGELQGEFDYEATIAVGLAACDAARMKDDNDFFLDGHEHYRHIVNSSFDGITGNVVFDPNTGSRDPTSTLYKLVNYVPIEGSTNETVQFEALTTHTFLEGEWQNAGDRQTIFNDGTTDIPLDIPPVSTVDHVVFMGVRGTVLVLFVVILLQSIWFMSWTERNKDTRVVLASQPFFLHTICLGIVIFGTSIIPMSFDHQIADLAGNTVACNASYWLLGIGFATTVSAFASKTHRVNKIMNNPNKYRRIRVTVKQAIKPMVVLLSLNILVLSLMSAWGPPTYRIFEERVDKFGRPSEIRGACTLVEDGSLPYVLTVIGINFGALVSALFEAWRARNLSTEYAESTSIFRALVSIVAVLFVAVPVYFLSSDNSNASLFCRGATVFVTSSLILLLTFVPKVQHCQETTLNLRREGETGPKIWSVSGLTEGDSDITNKVELRKSFRGMKIVTTKTMPELIASNSELTAENEELIERCAVLEGKIDDLESLLASSSIEIPNDTMT